MFGRQTLVPASLSGLFVLEFDMTTHKDHRPAGNGMFSASFFPYLLIRITHGAMTATIWHCFRSSCMVTATATTTFSHCTFPSNFLCNPLISATVYKKHVSLPV